jgi:hypothetical protein
MIIDDTFQHRIPRNQGCFLSYVDPDSAGRLGGETETGSLMLMSRYLPKRTNKTNEVDSPKRYRRHHIYSIELQYVRERGRKNTAPSNDVLSIAQLLSWLSLAGTTMTRTGSLSQRPIDEGKQSRRQRPIPRGLQITFRL